MLQVTFRHMTASDALRTVAQELLEKLHARTNGTERCHLVIDCVTADQERKPGQFTAHIDISFGTAGSLLHATSAQDDAAVAVREAFASIDRQLVEHRQLVDHQRRHTA